jgi:hypothetical protein
MENQGKGKEYTTIYWDEATTGNPLSFFQLCQYYIKGDKELYA